MIGPTLKELRRKKKLTQSQLAEKLGVSRQAICMWEADKRELNVTMLRKVARFFNVSSDEIVKPHRIPFTLKAPDAKSVSLTGDFNRWDTKGIPLKRNKGGSWNGGIKLRPGKYEYKFIVDDEWWTDPENPLTVETSVGSLNSVKEVTV